MLTHHEQSGVLRPAPIPHIRPQDRDKPVLALVKESAKTETLRTLLQHRGFLVVTVGWQQNSNRSTGTPSAAHEKAAPVSLGLVRTGSGDPTLPEYPKTVNLRVTSHLDARATVHFLDRLRGHSSIKMLLVEGSRYPDEIQIWLELREPLALEKLLTGAEGVQVLNRLHDCPEAVSRMKREQVSSIVE